MCRCGRKQRKARKSGRAADCDRRRILQGLSQAYRYRGVHTGFSSRGLSLRSHGSFETTQKAIRENADILSTVNVFETSERRVYVEDTDEGLRLQDQIEDLKRLVATYADGTLKEQE